MIEFANQYITDPKQTPGVDGVGYWQGENVWIHDCYIDLQDNDISELDEALALTRGAYGLVERCVIRGAAKNILIGSGEKEFRDVSVGKQITIQDCIIEQGGRRFPEVQDGYIVHLKRCLISDWGMKTRFKDRSFGAWAHGGGKIYADRCVFMQDSTNRGLKYWLMDKIGHIGQAVNDEGLKTLFQRKTYIAGTKRALTAGPNGYVQADACYFDDGLYAENVRSEMSDYEADNLLAQLEEMKKDLMHKFGIK